MISSVIKRFSLNNYSKCILLAALCFTPNTYADEHNEEEDRFDGSEFNASSFSDTSFDTPDYKELRPIRSVVVKFMKANKSSKEDGVLSRKHKTDQGITSARKNTEKGPLEAGGAGESKHDADLTGPVMDLPGDWVPDKLQLTNNGGFGIEPDNGSPVPYRLNGHVDIQRGRP